MKTLVLRQPWAALVEHGLKTVELRSWSTHYRGPIAILAGLGVDWLDIERLSIDLSALSRGALVCVVELTDIRPAVARDARAACVQTVRESLFAWHFENVRKLDQPIPALGRLGLYETDPKLMRSMNSASV